MSPRARLLGGGLVAAGAAAGYLGLVTGATPVDLGIGRRTRPLGPFELDVAAPREVVFEVLEQPYLPRASRAMQAKVRVLEHGADMVLAAHYTPIGGPLVATTVETVRFSRPGRIDFRLVRGPVPYVVEVFELTERGGVTEFAYRGEMGTDLGRVGECWGAVVARTWERTVLGSMTAAKAEAERRASAGASL